jgi:hypothetical protein
MPKLEESAIEPSRHPARSGSLPPDWWLAGHCDLLVLLAFLFASIDPAGLSPRALTIVDDLGLTDDSWHLDQVFKLSRGLWIGRDVAFTHGPVFQWLSTLPTRFVGISMGPIFATWGAVPVWCAFVFIYLTLRLLLAEQPAWKRAYLLFLAMVFWLVWWEFSLQNVFPVLLFASFLRAWCAVIEGGRKSYLLGIAAALPPRGPGSALNAETSTARTNRVVVNPIAFLTGMRQEAFRP